MKLNAVFFFFAAPSRNTIEAVYMKWDSWHDYGSRNKTSKLIEKIACLHLLHFFMQMQQFQTKCIAKKKTKLLVMNSAFSGNQWAIN